MYNFKIALKLEDIENLRNFLGGNGMPWETIVSIVTQCDKQIGQPIKLAD